MLAKLSRIFRCVSKEKTQKNGPRIRRGAYFGNVRVLHVFKNGKLLVVGPHWHLSIAMSLFHIIVATGFSVGIMSFGKYGYTLIGIFLSSMTLLLFCAASLVDPGIVLKERDRHSEIEFGEIVHKNTKSLTGHTFVTATDKGQENESMLSPDVKKAVVNESKQLDKNDQDDNTDDSAHLNLLGKPETTESTNNWCAVCLLYQPEGCEHCEDCDVCIRGFDHHCVWTSKCVGSGNALLFYGWLTTISTTLAYYAIATLQTQPTMPK